MSNRSRPQRAQIIDNAESALIDSSLVTQARRVAVCRSATATGWLRAALRAGVGWHTATRQVAVEGEPPGGRPSSARGSS